MRKLSHFIYIWCSLQLLASLQLFSHLQVKCAYIRDELMEAVTIADVQRVQFLLSLDQEVLTSRPPVLVNRRETTHNRTSLMVCGLDPQTTDRRQLDLNCAHIAKLLHQQGAVIDNVDRYGWDALAVAAAQGLLHFAEYLLDNGVVIDRVDKKGKTAAMKAAAQGFGEVFEMLVNRGANTSQRDEAGLTALHYATIYALNSNNGGSSGSSIDISSGIDSSIGNGEGVGAVTAEIIFLRRVRNAICAAANISATTATATATTTASASTLSSGLVMDAAIDSSSRTCLMYAAISNNAAAVAALLRDDNGLIISDPRLTDVHNVSAVSMSSNNSIRESLSEAVAELVQLQHQQWLAFTKTQIQKQGNSIKPSKGFGFKFKAGEQSSTDELR